MQLVGAADSTAVVGADPPTPPGLFPRGRYSTSVEWLSARHRESGIGSYADQEHPDQVGWHLADPEWYPSDLVRPEYKRLAIGANYEGPFALQLIMAAAPPAVDFAWEVQAAEDSFRHSLRHTVVGKGHWNTVACCNKLFPHGVLVGRKWADATEFTVEGSHLQMAGVFTDKIEVGSGVTIDFLEMSFRDGPLFNVPNGATPSLHLG